MSSSIKAVLKPHQRDIGNLFVRRVLPAMAARLVGPFIVFDHMGLAKTDDGAGVDVSTHPQPALATGQFL
ncbi:pirin family protein, partial [Burkholderia sp. Ac-20365]|nr:pirin family protein [Burkholderia sp. Ac-20365]